MSSAGILMIVRLPTPVWTPVVCYSSLDRVISHPASNSGPFDHRRGLDTEPGGLCAGWSGERNNTLASKPAPTEVPW